MEVENSQEKEENKTLSEENGEKKSKRRKKNQEQEETPTTDPFAIGNKCLALWRDDKYRKQTKINFKMT
jgi:hypothetical protein